MILCVCGEKTECLGVATGDWRPTTQSANAPPARIRCLTAPLLHGYLSQASFRRKQASTHLCRRGGNLAVEHSCDALDLLLKGPVPPSSLRIRPTSTHCTTSLHITAIQRYPLSHGTFSCGGSSGDQLCPSSVAPSSRRLVQLLIPQADSTSGLLKDGTKQGVWDVKQVVSEIPKHCRPSSGSALPVQFFHLLERLKTTKREGWRRFGIVHGESIADHMYRMSIITMLAPASLSSRLDIPRCTKMALIHDMAESLVGDITPVDGVAKEEKNRRESTTMDYVCKDLLGNVGGGLSGEEVRRIWQEYEDSETPESQFVHDVDKLELMLQMLEYERSKEGRLDLGEFSWVAKKIRMPEVREWCKTLLEERDAYWESVGTVPSGGQMSEQREAMQQEYYGANAS